MQTTCSAGVHFAQEEFFVNCSITRGVSSNFDISKAEIVKLRRDLKVLSKIDNTFVAQCVITNSMPQLPPSRNAQTDVL